MPEISSLWSFTNLSDIDKPFKKQIYVIDYIHEKEIITNEFMTDLYRLFNTDNYVYISFVGDKKIDFMKEFDVFKQNKIYIFFTNIFFIQKIHMSL